MADEVKITEADITALQRMPEGWFEWFEVGYRVRCPEFRLERLEKRRLVEKRYTGEWPNIEKRYRVIRDAADVAIKNWYEKRDAGWREQRAAALKARGNDK